MKIDGSAITADSPDEKILFLMDKAKIKGIELAIFNQRQVVYKQAFGIADDNNLPLHVTNIINQIQVIFYKPFTKEFCLLNG